MSHSFIFFLEARALLLLVVVSVGWLSRDEKCTSWTTTPYHVTLSLRTLGTSSERFRSPGLPMFGFQKPFRLSLIAPTQYNVFWLPYTERERSVLHLMILLPMNNICFRTSFPIANCLTHMYCVLGPIPRSFDRDSTCGRTQLQLNDSDARRSP